MRFCDCMKLLDYHNQRCYHLHLHQFNVNSKKPLVSFLHSNADFSCSHFFSRKKETILFKFSSLTSNNGNKYAKGEYTAWPSECIRRGTWNWNWILWITNLPFLWRLHNNISAQKCSDNKDNFNGNQCFVFRWAKS